MCCRDESCPINSQEDPSIVIGNSAEDVSLHQTYDFRPSVSPRPRRENITRSPRLTGAQNDPYATYIEPAAARTIRNAPSLIRRTVEETYEIPNEPNQTYCVSGRSSPRRAQPRRTQQPVQEPTVSETTITEEYVESLYPNFARNATYTRSPPGSRRGAGQTPSVRNTLGEYCYRNPNCAPLATTTPVRRDVTYNKNPTYCAPKGLANVTYSMSKVVSSESIGESNDGAMSTYGTVPDFTAPYADINEAYSPQVSRSYHTSSFSPKFTSSKVSRSGRYPETYLENSSDLYTRTFNPPSDLTGGTMDTSVFGRLMRGEVGGQIQGLSPPQLGRASAIQRGASYKICPAYKNVSPGSRRITQDRTFDVSRHGAIRDCRYQNMPPLSVNETTCFPPRAPRRAPQSATLSAAAAVEEGPKQTTKVRSQTRIESNAEKVTSQTESKTEISISPSSTARRTSDNKNLDRLEYAENEQLQKDLENWQRARRRLIYNTVSMTSKPTKSHYNFCDCDKKK